jgi:hypothetical protein
MVKRSLTTKSSVDSLEIQTPRHGRKDQIKRYKSLRDLFKNRIGLVLFAFCRSPSVLSATMWVTASIWFMEKLPPCSTTSRCISSLLWSGAKLAKSGTKWGQGERRRNEGQRSCLHFAFCNAVRFLWKMERRTCWMHTRSHRFLSRCKGLLFLDRWNETTNF